MEKVAESDETEGMGPSGATEFALCRIDYYSVGMKAGVGAPKTSVAVEISNTLASAETTAFTAFFPLNTW